MKALIRFFVFLGVVYLIITGVISLINESVEDPVFCQDAFEVINSGEHRMHERSWDFADYSKSFCASYISVESVSLATGRARNEILYSMDYSYENFWGSVYEQLVRDSNIGFLVDSLKEISIQESLNRIELAELVVTFVQDIPYSYVRAEDCSETNNKGKPCIGNIALGILSPYEFIHSLYGDCDTRAVLIFAILNEMGFDPMIVISDEYAHAMLALNIPASGDYLKHEGKKYYFWETTGKGWPLGMLPPNSNNINYWKIALVNDDQPTI
ncbi:transglutaminase-like domain-containing protein [Ekhidna sp.]|uniref:transglutaminase-like domain-containing protein n=1 Tax=Ekhidna sp. TaxID=2608089 RepID=UPI003C7D6689